MTSARKNFQVTDFYLDPQQLNSIEKSLTEKDNLLMCFLLAIGRTQLRHRLCETKNSTNSWPQRCKLKSLKAFPLRRIDTPDEVAEADLFWLRTRGYG
jgi:hypothetical protein